MFDMYASGAGPARQSDFKSKHPQPKRFPTPAQAGIWKNMHLAPPTGSTKEILTRLNEIERG